MPAKDKREIDNMSSFSEKPPRGLFSRVIKRLGLEKELAFVKKYFAIFIGLFCVFVFLSIFAFIGLKKVLADTNLATYLSLIISDPGMVIKFWSSYLYSILETIPGIFITLFLLASAFLLLIMKITAIYFEKLLKLIKIIKKQKNEYRKIV